MIYIGLDISKTTIDIVTLIEDKAHYQTIVNTELAINDFIESLTEDCHCCCEYTNIYHETIAKAVLSNGHKISIVNPYIVKHFSKTLTRNKTDRTDALILAKYAQIYQPKTWQPLQCQDLMQIQKRIEQLIKMRTQEQNRAHVSKNTSLNSIQRSIEFINQEIKCLEDEIEQLIKSNHALETKRDLLITIPGIGKKTANTLLPLLSNSERFETANKLVSYLGLAPQKYQSGTSVCRKDRITKMGNAFLRKALYMPARTACLRSKVFKEWAQAKLNAGKPPKVVYVAMMRKLLVYAFHVMKSNQPFTSQFGVWGLAPR